MFGDIVHGNLFTGFNDPNGDITPVGAAGVRIAGMIDEPRWRLHQDVLTVHDRNENPLFWWKSLEGFIVQYFPASIDDDFAWLNASCGKNSSSVNCRVVHDDFFHVLREFYRLWK